jgi:hypothetical protein
MAIAQPIIAGISVPDGIYNRGMYMFYPQEYETAGDGTAVAVGSQSAIWRYARLTASQLNWWRWIALAGANSRSTTFSLWIDDTRETVTSFTSGIVYAPNWKDVEALPGGWYGPVEFRFDFLLPITPAYTAFILGSSLLGATDKVLISEDYGT